MIQEKIMKKMKNWKDICGVRIFQINDMEIPAVSLGTSPFIGAGQFGNKAAEYYRTFFLQPENMEKMMIKSVELGIPAIQAIAYDIIIQAIKNVRDSLQLELFCSVSIGMEDWQRELEAARIIEPRIAFIHAVITDSRNKAQLQTIIDAIKKAKMIPGCVTHNPVKTIPFLEDSGLDVKIYMAPVNPAGIFLGAAPGEIAELIEKAKKPVMGKKVLAAGRIAPAEAFAFVSRVKNLKGIAVGIASQREAEETFAQAKKFWPK
ncbi:MAG: hypothetical protein JSV88_00320, partial [Candidatus Aminicenantes bacterium]